MARAGAGGGGRKCGFAGPGNGGARSGRCGGGSSRDLEDSGPGARQGSSNRDPGGARVGTECHAGAGAKVSRLSGQGITWEGSPPATPDLRGFGRLLCARTRADSPSLGRPRCPRPWRRPPPRARTLGAPAAVGWLKTRAAAGRARCGPAAAGGARRPERVVERAHSPRRASGACEGAAAAFRHWAT